MPAGLRPLLPTLTAAALLTAVLTAPADAAAARSANADTRAAQMCLGPHGRCDSSPPRLSLTVPHAPKAVSGRVSGRRCKAKARDNRRLRSVRFYVDDQRISSVRRWRGKESRRARWGCVWNTRRFAEGRHTLTAIARDAAGNRTSVAKRVLVARPELKEASAPADGQPGTGLAPRTPITGTTYYVSPTGSDDNPGTSPDQAWRTVARVHDAVLSPGDGVLFEAGASFGDDTLMPNESGTTGAPIVFGSYGIGRASLPQGIWFKGYSHLVFEALSVAQPGYQGVQGTGDSIVVRGCDLTDLQIGIQATGSNWRIEDNHIGRIGDSGLILWGAGHVVADNLIADTGLDRSITYGKHGIYLKASGTHIAGNTITSFTNSGVSARFRDSHIEGNTISGGEIGISWFQYDEVAGTSRWQDNVISEVTAAGIYVDPGGHGLTTHESFVIGGNTISRGNAVWLNLHPTTGTYRVAGNLLL